MDYLFLPVVLFFLVFLWFEALKARELVIRHCKKLCQSANVQLLDETVSLSAIYLERDDKGWPRLIRKYHFEVSEEGNDRSSGFVTLWRTFILSTQLINQQGQSVFHQDGGPTLH